MTKNQLACVVLAAGRGTRMKSAQPKVLHKIANRSMLGHILEYTKTAGSSRNCVVVGPNMEDVAGEAAVWDEHVAVAIQHEQLGTANAVDSARSCVASFEGIVVVLFGDTPLIEPETLKRLVCAVAESRSTVILGFTPDDPTGYGRLLVDDSGLVTAIREHADASDEERAIGLCNSGVLGFASGPLLFSIIDEIGNDNAQGEFYLTDVVEVGARRGIGTRFIECREDEVLGINTRAQLAQAENIFQDRLRLKAMENGATLISPKTTYFSADTETGKDVVVEPGVVFGPGVVVEDQVTIKAYSHLEGAHLRVGATVGPFARLRPGADIGEGAKVGNYVEIKNAKVEKGAKVNHLTYIGDARVGENANIGAGTITCNYDGFSKHHTDIGAGAFIGSNSALVAPVTIGDGAYVGSGSVITKNVTSGALAVGRGRQVERKGWVEDTRALRNRKRDAT